MGECTAKESEETNKERECFLRGYCAPNEVNVW
jgi:hypothetical protein